MKKERFNVEQILGVLKQLKLGHRCVQLDAGHYPFEAARPMIVVKLNAIHAVPLHIGE